MKKRPHFQKNSHDSQLFTELRKRIYTLVEGLPQSREISIKIKSILFPLLYFSFYLLALINGNSTYLYILYFIFMGFTLVLIYLNVIHEAAHNNIFHNKKYNKLVLFVFDLLGANSYIWQKRHVYSHHNYPNVEGWDTDIEQSGIIKIYPHGYAKGIQKLQHNFFFLVYPLYLFNWMIIRDFRDFFDKNRIIRKTQSTMPTIEKVKLIFFKIFYIFYQIGIPIMFFNISWKLALFSWFLQIIVASIFALFVLLPLHPLPNNKFPLPNSQGELPFGWMQHQLETTNDLTNNNWFIRNVLGSFNFHVVHHLFPNISYVYYDEISKEVEHFAQEHKLTYKKLPISKALEKHYHLLKSNASQVSYIFEE